MRALPLFLAIATAQPSLAAPTEQTGEQIYTQFCVACHGKDGTGPIGANFIEEPDRLTKPDEALDTVIRDGMTTDKAAMPPFGALLDEGARTRVIQYLRERFAPNDDSTEKNTNSPQKAN